MVIRVLFMQSQAFFGADSAIHAQLMRHFDRASVEVHAAVTSEPGPRNLAVNTLGQLQVISDLHIRRTDFGHSLHGVTRRQRLQAVTSTPALVGSLLSLAAYIRRRRIQVIHTTEKPRDALYGVLLGKLTGARSVVHMHVGYGEWQSGLVKWAMRHADGLVGVSRFVADSLIDAGYPAERVHVVHNGLDLSGWDDRLDGTATRRQLGVPQGAPTVGIISRLFRWKGHAHLVDAIALLKEEFPSVRLIIVGEDDPRGEPGAGSFRAELEQQVRRLGIESNVMFTGFRTDVPGLMAAFDVFAHPSWEEPFGMVFLEAMAMRKPVVAWASGGAPEVIVHNQTGLLAERPSVESLANALRTLLRDPALRRRLGDAGRERVERVFTPQHMCQAALEVYRSVVMAKR